MHAHFEGGHKPAKKLKFSQSKWNWAAILHGRICTPNSAQQSQNKVREGSDNVCLKMGVDLARSKSAVTTSGLGCNPPWLPNIVFQLVQCQRNSCCSAHQFEDGHKLAKKSKLGQNKGFGLQSPMAACRYIYLHHSSAQRPPCLLFVF